jgi:chaperonin GroEL
MKFRPLHDRVVVKRIAAEDKTDSGIIIPDTAGEDGSVVVGKILDKEQYNYGFDAQTGEYGNLLTKGIIDPTKVVRAALQGAASVAGLLITTEAMVAEVPRKQAASPAMPGGGLDF